MTEHWPPTGPGQPVYPPVAGPPYAAYPPPAPPGVGPVPPVPALAARPPGPPDLPRPGQHGLNVILYLAVTSVIVGIEALLTSTSQTTAGVIALLVGLAAVAAGVGVRGLARPIELRSAVALGGVALTTLGVALLANGLDVRPRSILALLTGTVLAAAVARLAPSAVAAGVALLAGLAAAGDLASLAGSNPFQAAAVAAALALLVIAASPYAAAAVGHPTAERWIAGTAAIAVAIAFYIDILAGPVIVTVAAAVAAAGMTMRAQRLRNLALAVGGLVGLAAGESRAAAGAGSSTTSVGVFLLVAGLLALAVVAVGTVVARTSRASGRPIVVASAVDAGLLVLGAVLFLISTSQLDRFYNSPFVNPFTPVIAPSPEPEFTPYPLPG